MADDTGGILGSIRAGLGRIGGLLDGLTDRLRGVFSGGLEDALPAPSTPEDALIPGEESFYQIDGPHSVTFGQVEGGADDWLQFIEVPLDADVTEFRFVVRDDGYASGFRTTTPFAADESPADAAARLDIGGDIVRVIFGKRE